MLHAESDVLENSSHPPSRVLARTLRALGHVRRFIRNPRVRSENITRALHRDAHLQGATFSAYNRYPDLFTACDQLLAATPAPCILSFGCATGEEAFSIAEYLPHARILGIDLNRWCLRQARRANTNPRVHFLHALSPEFAALPQFDAIFAMAVFQRSENRNRTAALAHPSLTFTKFEHQIAQLDARLKPGGLFFIDHADFRFTDTAVAANYVALDFPGCVIGHDRPLFGSDNRLVAMHYNLPRAFRKQPV